MFIFRIFFNLFGMASRMGLGILWLPLFILTRHIYLTLILAGLFVAWLYFSSDDVQTEQHRNPNQANFATDAKGHKLQVATPVRRVENGDSAFANDLYRQMTKPERAYYSQYFFWAMSNVPDGQTNQWNHIDIAGAITPDHSFANNSGARCRMFSEVLKVHAVQQNLTGMACDNGGGSWCKLSANATPACGLGHQPGFMDSISGAFGKLF